MTTEQAVMDKLKTLSPEEQQQVLEFAESLHEQNGSRSPRRVLKGALSHLNIHITEQEIREARREMWSGYVGEGD